MDAPHQGVCYLRLAPTNGEQVSSFFTLAASKKVNRYSKCSLHHDTPPASGTIPTSRVSHTAHIIILF